jgi:hypothetical protein
LKNGRKRIISDTVDEEREAIAEALRQLQFEIKAILIKLDDEAHIPEEYKGKVKKL